MSAQQYPQAIPLSREQQFLADHLVPVDSDYCAAIAYRRHTSAIRIRYDDGRTGVYFPYTESEALSFFHAPSKGEWSWTFIRIRGTKHGHRRGWAYE